VEPESCQIGARPVVGAPRSYDHRAIVPLTGDGLPSQAMRLRRSKGSPDRESRWTVAQQVGQFMLAGLVAVVIVGVATAIASRRIGEREAIVDARTTALVRAQGVVEPAVTDGLLTRPSPQPAAVAKVARVVESGVIDGSLVRVKIWNRDGMVVYSDEPRLEGKTYELGADELAALDRGRIEADVSDLSAPENRYERPERKLLEVYLPIPTPSGRRLLFEAYFRYGAVSAAGSRIWRSFAPISLGALILLEVIQVPLAWSLARRLRQRQREREALLHQTLAASDLERRRIAADLHDGVVQDLTGVAYALTGAARRPDVPPETAHELERSATGVRTGVKALRSLLIEIYPPNLAEIGLATALTDLVARAELRDVSATLDTAGLRESLPGPVAGLLYRCAQEGLRNVFAHSRARSVVVRVASDDQRAVLEVHDDGVGFDPDRVGSGVTRGHFGLQGIEDLVAAAGGSARVRSAPGHGTDLHVEVPLR
jgi:two-component system, NarL family, sensor kinase